MKTLYAISAALLLALCLSTAFHLDDHAGDSDAAAAAIAEQSEAIRFAAAAQKVCGPNSAYTLTARVGEIQCLLHTGRKSIVAKVAL